jgi:hypothetical protein
MRNEAGGIVRLQQYVIHLCVVSFDSLCWFHCALLLLACGLGMDAAGWNYNT